MGKIAKVIVDLPIREVNKEFDYLIPDRLKDKVQLGQVIKVPFGRRKVSGFITALNKKSELDNSKIKEVLEILYQKPFFDAELLKLFKWISAYYHSYLIQVIKTALPPGITENSVRRKEVKFVKTADDIDDTEKILKELKNSAPKQFQIFKQLTLNGNKKISLKKAAENAQTSKQTVYRLIEKGYLKEYNDYIDRVPDFSDESDDLLRASKFKTNIFTKEADSLIESIYNNFNTNKKDNKILLETAGFNDNYNFYINLLNKFTRGNKTAILLMPEIDKNFLLLKKLKNYYKEKIAFIHSQLSKGERFDEWRRIQRGEVKIAVGARSAVFAPLKNLSLIIIKEENNKIYKQLEHPLYHARQVAAKRIKEKDCLLLLTADYPSIESRYYADKGNYRYRRLSDNNKIKSRIVDLKKEIEKGNLSDISNYLKERIKKSLEKKEKVLLFLNRRGYGNYVLCKKCGNVINCDNCDIALNYHQSENKLLCHYCGLSKDMPDKCPECGSTFLSSAGIGTENLVEQITEIFPEAVAARLDSDSTDDYRKIIKDFKSGKINILAATQIIIKKDFFSDLNFIGVISADTALNNSDFRAAEDSFKLLNELKMLLKNDSESEFVIQTFNPEHHSIQAAAESNYDEFYKKELKIRKKRNYPPFCRLINIIIQGKDEKKTRQKAYKLNNYLEKFNDNYSEKMGVSEAALKKIRNKYRWQIILKFNSLRNREYIIQLVEKNFKESEKNSNDIEIRIDVDPYRML
ncbi:MAG: replication restart helicase PriA [Halanaerobium sp.]